MVSIRWIVCAALISGCVEVDEVSELAQAIDPPWDDRCGGCGANGVNQNEWDAMFNQADRPALIAAQLWDGTIGPRSLCKAATVGAHECTLRPEWAAWVGGNGNRMAMMTHFAKIIARDNYAVRGPNGITYHGEFGLATSALSQSWGYDDQETIAAGMLALGNAEPGVPVCLNNRRTPNNCIGSGAFAFESVFFGDTFRTHWAAVSGGVHAKDPTRNLRFSRMLSTSAPAFGYDLDKCETSYNGEATTVTTCTEHGIVWKNPVVVLVPFTPGAWYYDVGARPKPRPHDVPAV